MYQTSRCKLPESAWVYFNLFKINYAGLNAMGIEIKCSSLKQDPFSIYASLLP